MADDVPKLSHLQTTSRWFILRRLQQAGHGDLKRGATVKVTINNLDVDDIFLTVTDLNSGSDKPILVRAQLDYGQHQLLMVVADQAGRGQIEWVAEAAKTHRARIETVSFNAGEIISVKT
ncbi:hypothetical protein [Andreprevotia lacus]|uniref:hypothetical protein n=1 Tax=Andreprevotia lacus TaxID=1121000 RepID=UPI000A03314B|nr:hypothetical protein [Andreprevotia lacus]